MSDDNKKVLSLRLRYIVPFRYQGTVEEAARRLETQAGGDIRWQPKAPDMGREDSDLYEYVRNEVCLNDGQEISDKQSGCAWEAEKNCNGEPLKRLLYSLIKPNNIDASVMEVDISDAGLLLFRNQLGLFWYELQIPQKEQLDMQRLLQFQTQVRWLNSPKRTVLWERQAAGSDHTISTPEGIYYSPFSMGHWVHEVVGVTGARYFAGRENHYYRMLRNSLDSKAAIVKPEGALPQLPHKAILFTYAAFTEECEDRHAYVYHLTNGYKANVHFSEETRQDMQEPFEGAYWYATQEGAAYMAWPVQDNTQFYGEYLPNTKIRLDYFTLYLKVLYQSFSLLLYAERIQAEISAVSGEHLKRSEDRSITALSAEINLFLVKSMATSVSYVHHQSEFYVYLKRRLRVQEDVTSVTAGLNALDTLHREQDKREEERERRESEDRDKESDKKIERAMTVLSVLSVCSALVDGYDFLAKFNDVNGEFRDLSFGWQVAEGVLIAAILLLSAWLLGGVFLRIYRESKEDKENKDHKYK